MPLPTSKSELLKKLVEAYEKLDAEFEGLSKADSRKKAFEVTSQRATSLLIKLDGVNFLLDWEKLERAGKTPEMPIQGYKWNELGRLAESFYKKHNKKSLENLRVDFKTIVEDVSRMINELTEKELLR